MTLPPWPLTWITQRKRLVSYQFIYMTWSKSQSQSRVLDVDALTALVLLTSWQYSTVKATRFTSSTDFHFLLGYHQNKYATLQRERGFGLADFATQSTQLVQNKQSYNVSNTSQSCCSCLETACRSPPLPRNECIRYDSSRTSRSCCKQEQLFSASTQAVIYSFQGTMW